VNAADLPGFCLTLTDFAATFQPTGQPKSFKATAEVTWTDRDEPDRTANFTVNDPLRLHGTNVHLLGHGYAPILRYTDRYGQSQTNVFPFLPTDGMLTSEGVATFPDANVEPRTNTRRDDLQVGFEGVYLPTVDPAGGITSAFPAERSPALFLTAYRGNLGLDTGLSRSVYSLDRGQITRGRLKQVAGTRPYTLRPGETWTLDDGTRLEFLGTRPFIAMAIRHDPTQSLVLVGAVLGLIGLMGSLGGHRRRVWFSVAPDPSHTGGSVVTAGGLPRTDYPGFADEFTGLVAATRATPADPSAQRSTADAAAGDDHPERTA
jgi:cytochrome c biogenesis protein